MKIFFTLALVLLLTSISVQLSAQETVIFDTQNLKNGKIDPAGMNLCWLLDSDIERPRTNSMSQRITEMKAGALRFPYGHLANNYLWDTAPYGGTLVPKVAASGVIPGNWSWATNTDQTFKKDMDFDEFMSLCSTTNSEALVVVNVMSHKYTNGPSYDTLKKVAVEWVKYAKAKGYNVAYWQLGNEMDHHQDKMTKAEYVALYQDFVTAMKAEDPAIKCGPGILSGTGYFNDIMNQAPQTVDFTSCHQYLFGQAWIDYAGWRETTISGTTNNVNSMQNAVNNSSKPDLPILITESNAYGNWDNTNNTALYKGLAWFDLLFDEQQYEDVTYSFMWNSHTPWNGETGEEAVANAWFNNADNKLTTMGWAPYILNNTLQEKYMIPDSKIQGKTHSYGAYTPSTGEMTIYLMNKDNQADSMNVVLNNFQIDTTATERWLFTGTSAWDKYPTFTQAGSMTYNANGFSTDLPPYSLVVVKLEKQPEPPLVTYFMDNIGINKRMKSNQADNDVELTATTDQGWRGKWELDSVGNGNFFIICRANNMRLRGINSNQTDPSSIELVDSTWTGTWVQWQLTPVGNDYYIDNFAHGVRLMASGTGEVVFGSQSWTGDWVKWTLTESSEENNERESGEPLKILAVSTIELNECKIHPNPANSRTTISYNLLQESRTTLRVYNIQGMVLHEVINETQSVGEHKIDLDISGFETGLYLVEINNTPLNGEQSFKSTQKLIIK